MGQGPGKSNAPKPASTGQSREEGAAAGDKEVMCWRICGGPVENPRVCRCGVAACSRGRQVAGDEGFRLMCEEIF